MAKTNIEHLRDILSKYELEDTKEAIEFLDAIEEDFTDVEDEKTKLEEEKKELENEIAELEDKEENVTYNESFVGLDTLYWGLDKGNLKIEMQIERFIETLQKQNAVVPA